MLQVEKMFFLGKMPLFQNLDSRGLAEIAAIARESTYLAGQRIIQEKAHGDHMFLIVDGEVKIHLGDTALKVLGPREFFGEMSIIDGEPRSASATAASDCLLLRVDREDFLDLLSSQSGVALSVIRTLVRRLREQLPALERAEKGM